jgi:hypothetical protein
MEPMRGDMLRSINTDTGRDRSSAVDASLERGGVGVVGAGTMPSSPLRVP